MRFPTRLSLAILCAAAISVAAPAPAGVIERDFIPGSGDGLLTYDDVNQREWLDVTVFAGEWGSRDEWNRVWTTPGYDFTQLFPELAPGGIYEDFTLATGDDAIALAESGGIDTTTHDFETNDAAVANMIDLLGVTHSTSQDPITLKCAGVTEDFQIRQGFGQYRVFAGFTHKQPTFPGGGMAVLTVGIFPSTGDAVGLMLYRNVIPEPASVFMLGFGSCVVLLIQRRQVLG